MTISLTDPELYGDFSAYLSGTLRGSPGAWTFDGTMRYSDTYNFENHRGAYVRNAIVTPVRVGVLGVGFQVESELAPVKQSSTEDELQWKGTGVRNPDRGLY